MTGFRRRALCAVFAAAIVGAPTQAWAADWQLRPFVGFTFAGDTTFVLSDAASKPHATIGVNATWLGDIVGVDVDIARTGGFFQTGDAGELVIGSSVTTVTGNVVVGVPRRFTEYVLRPYVVAGGGVMRMRLEDVYEVFSFSQVRPTVDFGAGAVGFITNRVGVAWEVRRFQSIGAEQQIGLSLGDEKLSFWRATMAVAIRY